MSVEYGTGSVWDDEWDGEREINPSPAALGASIQLQRRIAEWERRYEATFDPGDPRSSGFDSQAEADAFNAEGERIAELLQEELGAGVLVRYVPRQPRRS